ncbi:MAG: relaxase/mobilization nuclease domain-containing protein [Oscillospiraceae bacterium]
MHCHIVFNSVSFMDGKKYRSDFKSYFHDLRDTSNAVSREHGFSVIDSNGQGKHYSEWNAERNGKTTVRDLIRHDIDAALAESLTYDTFLETLRRQGYSVKRRSKCQAYRRPSARGARFVRLDSLGDGYTEADLMQRLRRQRGVTAAIPPEQSESKRYTIRKQPRRYPPVKRGSFRALYLYYLYLLSPRKRKPQKIPFETRAEVRRAKQYRQQFFLLQKYHIDTNPELEMLSDALSNEMQILVDRRKELYALRREQPSEQLDADIDALNHAAQALASGTAVKRKNRGICAADATAGAGNNTPPTENHAPDKARERRHSLWR